MVNMHPVNPNPDPAAPAEKEYRAHAHADLALIYVANVMGDALDLGLLKPKGWNISEGGFDADESKNATFTGEIGTEKGSGRAADLRFEMENAESAEDAGWGPMQKGIEKVGVGYEHLRTDEQA